MLQFVINSIQCFPFYCVSKFFIRLKDSMEKNVFWVFNDPVENLIIFLMYLIILIINPQNGFYGFELIIFVKVKYVQYTFSFDRFHFYVAMIY